MYSQIQQLINATIVLTDKEWQQFKTHLTFRQVPKKFKLVEEGKVSNEIYFINKGLIRFYYNKDGEDITGFIFTENLFASSYESFLRKSPSTQILETIEDCELLVLTYDGLQELYEKVPQINIFTRKIAEQRFLNAQQVLSSYILDSPEERYQKFLKQYPNIIQRVPLNIIASYLGITPVSLSRIRKRVTK
jgi:CRP-like cAMP-binding protein